MQSCGPRAHRRDTASDCPTDTPVTALQLSSLAPTRRTSHSEPVTASHRGRHVHCIVQFYSRNLMQQLSHLRSIECLTHSTDCLGLAESKLFREVGSAVWLAPATEVLFGLHILIKVVFSLNVFLYHRTAQPFSRYKHEAAVGHRLHCAADSSTAEQVQQSRAALAAHQLIEFLFEFVAQLGRQKVQDLQIHPSASATALHLRAQQPEHVERAWRRCRQRSVSRSARHSGR